MADQTILMQSSRVALAALLHDLGKFAERARIQVDRERIETWKQLDCPHWDGRPTHIHAAYTTAGFTAIEHLLPPRRLLLDAPFADAHASDADDSLINAAAQHHKPTSFLQWIIATADRLASGFERSEFFMPSARKNVSANTILRKSRCILKRSVKYKATHFMGKYGWIENLLDGMRL